MNESESFQKWSTKVKETLIALDIDPNRARLFESATLQLVFNHPCDKGCVAHSLALTESRQVFGEMAEAQRSVIPCIRDRLFSSWRIRGALALVAAHFVATTSDDARPVPRASLRPRLAAPFIPVRQVPRFTGMPALHRFAARMALSGGHRARPEHQRRVQVARGSRLQAHGRCGACDQ
jgi:hypothetical protein